MAEPAGSGLRLAQPVLDLGEELLDIEIGGVLRQEEKSSAGLADGSPERVGLVRAEIVHHDDVDGLELRH